MVQTVKQQDEWYLTTPVFCGQDAAGFVRCLHESFEQVSEERTEGLQIVFEKCRAGCGAVRLRYKRHGVVHG